MPKGKGGKKKKRGKKQEQGARKLEILRGEGQEYGKILERKGGPIMSVRLLTGKTLIGVIRGSMRRRAWMKAGDIVLASIRNFQDSKVDIIHVYPLEHTHDLVNLGEIPESFTIAEGFTDDTNNTQQDNIFGGGGRETFTSEEEWENKYKKLKDGWELYLQQGNMKKAREMKDRMDKLITKKPKKQIPSMTDADIDHI